MNCWESWADRDPSRQWHQQDLQKSTVSDLVYRYLNKIAEKNSRRQQRNNARNKFRREHAHRKKRLYSPNCLPSRERGARRQPVAAEKTFHQTSDLSDFSKIEDFSPSRQKSIADHRYPSTDFLAANYTKAADEGKNRRKMYVRKALSFGVNMGYLSPIDPEGRAIRVSPSLGFFYRRRYTHF